MTSIPERHTRMLRPVNHARNHRMLLAGISARFRVANCAAGIADLWRRFSVHVDNVVDQCGDTMYGVRYNTDRPDEMEYLCAVEVAEFSSVPRNFTLLCVPVQHCAVFRAASLAALAETWTSIREGWLPGSGYETVGTQFERYSSSFDPTTAEGELEVWLPVAPALRPGFRKDGLGARLRSEAGWMGGWAAATDR